jgi:PAS domain S-box-containing protein
MNMLMLPDFRVRQRDFLLEISRAITAQLDLGEVLRRIVNASVVMLAGQVGVIALRAPDGLFYIRAANGIDSDLIPVLNQDLHELAKISSGELEPELFNQKLREMASKIDSQLRQSVALPLAFADESLGMMIVFRTYRSGATANDLQILQSFADQAAIAVYNAQLYENMNHERKRLAAILEYSADGVMILDSDLKILRINRALERMTGWSNQDAIGEPHEYVIVWDKLEGGDLQKAIDDGWLTDSTSHIGDETPLYVEGDLKRKDSMSISIAITYAPLFTTEGRLANIIANVRDITNFRKAQEMQNTFISIISHELKTPVALIKGYAATLRRPDANWDSKTVEEHLGIIEEEADRLSGLIENLLTASRLQTEHAMGLQIGEVWFKNLAERSVERFKTQTAVHDFLVAFPNDFPVIEGDETKLRQVIDNFLSNAIKYSPNGGDVEIGGHFTDNLVTVYVKDSGVGLPIEEQERVFERFYRVDGKLSRKTQGAGLGLFLSKAIIEAHGGTVGVDSKSGNGATFYFTLPY